MYYTTHGTEHTMVSNSMCTVGQTLMIFGWRVSSFGSLVCSRLYGLLCVSALISRVGNAHQPLCIQTQSHTHKYTHMLYIPACPAEKIRIGIRSWNWNRQRNRKWKKNHKMKKYLTSLWGYMCISIAHTPCMTLMFCKIFLVISLEFH